SYSITRVVYLHHHHFFPTRRSSDLFDTPFPAHARQSNNRPAVRTRKCCLRPSPFSYPKTFRNNKPPDHIGGDRTVHWRNNISPRSEEHTSELQSREKIVCHLLLDKK